MSARTEVTAPEILLTVEQEDLAQMMRRVFGDWERTARDEGNLEAGYDPTLWRAMGVDLGLLGVDIPTLYGGEGFSAVELGLTMAEMGAFLIPSPYLSSVVLGAGLLMAARDEEAMTEHLPGLAAGDLQVAVAIDETGRGWSAAGIAAAAEPTGSGSYRLNGVKVNVVDGHTASLLLIAARTRSGIGIFAARAGAPGLDAVEVSSIDPTRRLSRIELRELEAVPVGDPKSGWGAVEELRDRTLSCLACEQVGAARACLGMAVEYAKVRRQFNRAIGSFQAIKHACADLYVGLEAAESSARFAIACLAATAPETTAAAALAAAASSEILAKAAAANVQIHGGIGFTWEHPAHRYYRRATAAKVLFGTASQHRLRAFEAIDRQK